LQKIKKLNNNLFEKCDEIFLAEMKTQRGEEEEEEEGEEYCWAMPQAAGRVWCDRLASYALEFGLPLNCHVYSRSYIITRMYVYLFSTCLKFDLRPIFLAIE
jgi:hypothetical protein